MQTPIHLVWSQLSIMSSQFKRLTEMLTSTRCTEISAASVNTLVVFLKKSCPVNLNTSPKPLNLNYFKSLLVSHYVDASSQVHAALVGTAVLWAFMELRQVKYKSPMPNRPCSQQSILACPSVPATPGFHLRNGGVHPAQLWLPHRPVHIPTLGGRTRAH